MMAGSFHHSFSKCLLAASVDERCVNTKGHTLFRAQLLGTSKS